jgi:hypothetical protein
MRSAMRKLMFLLVLALLAFYVAWPAWSAYRIHGALETKNAALLEAKMDLPSVRESLRPAVAAAVERALERGSSGGVGGQILGGNIKQQLAPRLVEAVLTSFVTAPNIIELYQRRGDLKAIIDEQMSRMGGTAGGGAGGGNVLGGVLGGLGRAPAPKPVANPVRDVTKEDAAQAKPGSTGGFSTANIKRFRPAGLAAWEVGAAKDPAATDPDVTARIAFKDGDWKVVAVEPRIKP